MVETAAHITDQILPRVPYRQWVLPSRGWEMHGDADSRHALDRFQARDPGRCAAGHGGRGGHEADGHEGEAAGHGGAPGARGRGWAKTMMTGAANARSPAIGCRLRKPTLDGRSGAGGGRASGATIT